MNGPAPAATGEEGRPPGDAPGDAALVAAYLNGDRGAFNPLVRRHAPRVFNYIMQLVRHRQDAEDVTQQAFIKAARHLGSFDPARPFAAWLFTIARRTALNHFRTARKFEAVSEDAESGEISPARRVEERDQLDALWALARRELPVREFEVLWLRYAEDLPISAAARVLGLTETHTKIIAFRARQRLVKLQSSL